MYKVTWLMNYIAIIWAPSEVIMYFLLFAEVDSVPFLDTHLYRHVYHKLTILINNNLQHTMNNQINT